MAEQELPAILTCGWCGKKVKGTVVRYEDGEIEWVSFPHECGEQELKGPFVEDIEILEE